MSKAEQPNEATDLPKGPLNDLTGFQRDVLSALSHLGGCKGLKIKSFLEEFYDKEIHHGRLYPNLDTLVGKGLVEKGTVDRRTNYYTLTRRGQREIKADHKWRASCLEDNDAK